LANHPVVGVTWYEALVFALWLDEEVSKNSHQLFKNNNLTQAEKPLWQGATEGRLHINLPSEPE
jgi:formylglycine-generating enzyme required for sulfatase activity